MLTYIRVFVTALFAGVWVDAVPVLYNVTSCEEFEEGAQFHPNETLDSYWRIFYWWSEDTELYPVKFFAADKTRVDEFREIFDAGNQDLEIEWDKASLLMSPKSGIQILFLDMGIGGEMGVFRAIVIEEQVDKEPSYYEPLTKFADIRMKIVNRVLAMMCCEELSVYAMIRIDETPDTHEKCQKLAATVGVHWPQYKGRSYFSVK